MRYYSQELSNIYEHFDTDPMTGLTDEEAQKRIETHGLNELPKISKGFIKIYLAPLFNWLIVIYLIGAVLLYIGAIAKDESPPSMIYIVLGIVFLNCIIAIYQQYKATKKLDALRELSAPTCTVLRNGQKTEISSKNIVVGDILIIEHGDKIPADARIIESVNLELNEASLTGESETVKKSGKFSPVGKEELAISERANMVFYGTFITIGNAKAVVVKTGVDTEIGKISKGLQEAGTSKIPIREKMNYFGKWLGILVFCAWLISLVIFQVEFVASLNAAMDLMPINLPLLTTIILFTGVLSMAQEGVIIRNIASVESLGRVSVVCSDKTGTLTQNQMSIQYVWCNNQDFEVTGVGYEPIGDIIDVIDPKSPKKIENIEDYPHLKFLLCAGELNNNSEVIKHNSKGDNPNDITSESWQILGSPTEGALRVLFKKIMDEKELSDYELIKEFPFSSKLKRMTKIYKQKEQYLSFTKGASEILLPLCSKIIIDGKEESFTKERKQSINEKINSFANKGYRILSLSYKKLAEAPKEDDNRDLFEKDKVFLGFVTISDPPREGVKESIEKCYDAGVDVVMITGDSPATAKSIAEQISIIHNQDEIAIEGKDINKEQELSQFKKNKVFARVSPEHKQDIIEVYQKEKKVVAMTGDGVNDALALNMADAGIAMGITGTDVAKESSDMVLSDDSFNSIVIGISRGRAIFARIRAIVFFFIAINVFLGIVGFIIAVALGRPFWVDPYSPFFPQWLFLSMTIKMFPSLGLTFDKEPDDVMKMKPRDSEEIISKNTFYLMLVFGVLLAVSVSIVYFLCIEGAYGYEANVSLGTRNQDFLFTAETMYLTEGIDLNQAKTFTMLMAVLFVVITCMVFQIRRPNKNVIKSLIEKDFNISMIILMVINWFCFLALLYIPGVQTQMAEWALDGGFWSTFNFKFMYLTGLDWLIVIGISSICFIGLELAKTIARRREIIF